MDREYRNKLACTNEAQKIQSHTRSLFSRKDKDKEYEIDDKEQKTQ